jgi:hypothetical protein
MQRRLAKLPPWVVQGPVPLASAKSATRSNTSVHHATEMPLRAAPSSNPVRASRDVWPTRNGYRTLTTRATDGTNVSPPEVPTFRSTNSM